jgi:preflagellin peptidase FlaK
LLGEGVPPLEVAAWGILLAGFAYAAYVDLRTREAPDFLWSALGASGTAVGLLALYPEGTIAWASWLFVAALILEHFLPWDVRLEKRREWLPGVVELAAYLLVGAVLAWLVARTGVGSGGVPTVVIAAYVAVVVVRGFFELGLLYGGADAKALIAAAALIPLATGTLFGLPENAARIATIIPGPLALLMNAALAAAVVPLGLAVRNLSRGEFQFPGSFVGYTIPVRELTERFVWLRDPVFGTPTPEEEAVESSEDDRALRSRQRAELEAAGVERVWVTPQLPFLLFLFIGAVLLAVAGNLLFDLIALL